MPTDVKPFIYPVRAIDNSIPVNILVMSTFAPIDKKDVRNKNEDGSPKVSYSIVFSEPTVAKAGQSIEWRYADKDCRDQDLAEINELVSQILGNS